jgi:hypothetical protein
MLILRTFALLRMSTGLHETCRGVKYIYYTKNCALSWLPTTNYTKMHGPKNILKKSKHFNVFVGVSIVLV